MMKCAVAVCNVASQPTQSFVATALFTLKPFTLDLSTSHHDLLQPNNGFKASSATVQKKCAA